MSNPEFTQDDDYEKLKKRRLDVVNTATDEAAAEGMVLEGDGLGPPVDAVPIPILKDRIVQTLKTIYDPEIPLNIYDLGLVYDVLPTEEGKVHVRMTLTAPACPAAGALVNEVHDRVRVIPGVKQAKTELVWDPPWTKERLSLEAQLELGLL